MKWRLFWIWVYAACGYSWIVNDHNPWWAGAGTVLFLLALNDIRKLEVVK